MRFVIQIDAFVAFEFDFDAVEFDEMRCIEALARLDHDFGILNNFFFANRKFIVCKNQCVICLKFDDGEELIAVEKA